MMRRALVLAMFVSLAPVARGQEPPPGATLDRFELKEARVADAARLLAELADWNVVVTPDAAAKSVSLFLRRVPARGALEAMCKVAGLWYREDAGIFRLMTADEYQKDLVVQREAKLKVFTLLQPNGVAVAQAIRDLFGQRVTLSFGAADQLSQDASLSGLLGQGGGGTQAFGSGTTPFSTSFQGGVQSTFGQLGQSTTGGADAGEERAERLAPELTPEQLSRVKVAEGKATGDLAGLTAGRPPIAVTVNRRHNLVAVRTTDDEALKQIEGLVVELDRPTPQVLLEMKVLELRLDDGRSTAVDVDWIEDPARPNLPTGKPANPLDLSQAAGLAHVAGLGNFPVAGGAVVYQFLDEHVRVRLQALEREGRVGVLASPLLLCANNEVARIFIGEERPLVRSFQLQTTTTNGVVTNQVVPTIDLRDIGNTLRIVPRINADRTVALTIIQDVSSVNAGGASIPVPGGGAGVQLVAVDTVDTANLQGTVVAKDGLTLAVGGLIRKELRDRRTGIPFLMDLPVVGWLFGSHERVEEQRELVLLITPHVLFTPAEGAERTKQRMEALSLHPYHDLGDAAVQRYRRDDVPGSADYRLLVEDYLIGAPEPLR